MAKFNSDLTAGTLESTNDAHPLLRQTEDILLHRHRLLLSTINDPISFVDRHYIYRTVNDAYMKIFKRPREEIIGHSVADLLGEEVFEKKVKHHIDRALLGEKIDYENWFDYPQWGRRYVIMRYYPFIETDGTISGIAVTAQDITTHKLTEEALRRTSRELAIRERIDHIFLTAPNDEIRTNILEAVLAVTDSTCGMLGLIDSDANMVYTSMKKTRKDRYQIIAKDCLFRPHELDLLRQAIPLAARTFCSDTPPLLEQYIPATSRFMMTRIMSHGHIIGFLLMTGKDSAYGEHDTRLLEMINNNLSPITRIWLRRIREEKERKAAEAALRRAHEELELTVEKRTLELMQTNEHLENEIEERRQAEKARRASEDEYRSLFENLQEVFYRTDSSGRVTIISPYIEKITGYTPDEFIGKRIGDFYVTPQERDKLWQSLLDNEYVENYEVLLKRRNGTSVWLSANARLFKNGAGEVLGLEGTARDISERKEMEEELRHREEMLRAQYLSIPIPTYTWRKQGEDFILVDFNKASEDFTSGHISHYVGRRAQDLYRTRHDIIYDFKRCFRMRSSIKRDTPYRMFTTEEEKHITLTCAYVPPDMVMVHMEDITQSKLAQEKLKRSEKNLRLLSSQLLTAKEEERKRIAQDLHDSIGQHLTTIKFNTENALCQMERRDGPITLHCLKITIPIIQRTIVEVRRISMDLRPPTLDDLGIVATISWFCREFQNVYTDISIHQNIEVEEQEIPEDLKTTIFRILQEAFNNIAKHSRATIVTLTLRRTADLIELKIRDNGTGFNVREKTMNEENPTGIGLASMEERAELSGGIFSLQSKPNVGTTITSSWHIC